jgi:hypothetical protein
MPLIPMLVANTDVFGAIQQVLSLGILDTKKINGVLLLMSKSMRLKS